MYELKHPEYFNHGLNNVEGSYRLSLLEILSGICLIPVFVLFLFPSALLLFVATIFSPFISDSYLEDY